jgi:hypothetical protein
VLRREAVASTLTRLVDGEPGLIIDPRCTIARKGMAGGYRYRRVQVTGAERFQDKPEKNHFSHVCEAGQYMLLGAGEGRSLVRMQFSGRAPIAADNEYDPMSAVSPAEQRGFTSGGGRGRFGRTIEDQEWEPLA